MSLSLLAAVAIAALGTECTAAQPPPAEARNCGTVVVVAQDPPTDPGALEAERCFLAAYMACQAETTLTLETRGVDVLSRTTFTLVSGSPCGVTGMTETTIVPGRHSSSSFTCARVSPKDGGLQVVACGRSGDIFIPSPAR